MTVRPNRTRRLAPLVGDGEKPLYVALTAIERHGGFAGDPTGDLINRLGDRLMQVVERAADRLPEIGAQGRPASGDRSYLRTSPVHAGRVSRLKKMRDLR